MFKKVTALLSALALCVCILAVVSAPIKIAPQAGPRFICEDATY